MTDWLKYEWEYNDQEAVFQVDMQYWELLPALAYSHLVFVSIAPRDPDAEAFSRMEEHRTTMLQHQLAEQLVLENLATYRRSAAFNASLKPVLHVLLFNVRLHYNIFSNDSHNLVDDLRVLGVCR